MALKQARVLALAALAALVAAPPLAWAQDGPLARAVSCKLEDGAVAGLMSRLAEQDPGLKTPAQSLAAPSGALYRLTSPVSALGVSSNEIYVTPGRILMVVSGQGLATVSARLKLTAEPNTPDTRRIDETHAVVAYQLHQAPLAGKVLVGCAYDHPDALAWLASDMAGF